MSDAERRLLEPLNPEQRQAVLHRDGPLLVLAGPGSGKTRVITHRAAYLVHTGVPARHVLAITFTNKAAREMRDRIAGLHAAAGMWIHTFHALGVRLLRELGPLVDVQPGFTIYDEADQRKLMDEAMEGAGVKEAYLRADAVQAAISDAKNRLVTPSELQAHATLPNQLAVARVYEAYEQLLRQRNAVDFDDLLMRLALLLRQRPDVTERLNQRFHYLLIDEYQDTNRAQYVIARELSRLHHNICATGDPDQSIYAWRGADIGNILAFERDYPEAVVVRLEQNYRSTAHILRTADKLISANRRRKHKTLWTRNDAGAPVEVWRFNDGRDEAERIAATIDEQHKQGRPYGDFAIFYRINAVSRGMEESLRHRGVPYRIARGVEFYNRKEIKDALSYLRALVNPADDVAVLRCINTPARGIGKTTLEKLQAESGRRRQPLLATLREPGAAGLGPAAAAKLARFVKLLNEMVRYAEQHSIADTVDHVVAKSGLREMLKDDKESGGEDRLANLDELVSAAKRYEEDQPDEDEISLVDFLRRVSLTSDQDSVDSATGAVMLMTLHTAKGLEFPVVFLAGLEQGLLPHERALAESGDVEEERRLCFVGITRARERLYLTHANLRLLRGQLMPRIASQFLRELDIPDAVQSCDFTDRFRSSRRSPWQDNEPDSLDREDDEPLTPKSLRRRNARSAFGAQAEPVFTKEDAARAGGVPPAPPRAEQQPSQWRAGMMVQHALYGIGVITAIHPQSAQTRAEIQFPGAGRKTFVLELAPIQPLQRRP